VAQSVPIRPIRPEGWRMTLHIWLFRFLLAWNVILLAALIVMAIG
jgi:hypothetical protein